MMTVPKQIHLNLRHVIVTMMRTSSDCIIVLMTAKQEMSCSSLCDKFWAYENLLAHVPCLQKYFGASVIIWNGCKGCAKAFVGVAESILAGT
eukprot:6211273-Pleurochrysis_carterae.AAC.1